MASSTADLVGSKFNIMGGSSAKIANNPVPGQDANQGNIKSLSFHLIVG